MARYSIYSFEGAKLIGTAEFIAASDRAAAEIAKLKGEGRTVEVWSGPRRVRTVSTQ